MRKHHTSWSPPLLLALFTTFPAAALKSDGPGVSDSEIKLGHSMATTSP